MNQLAQIKQDSLPALVRTAAQRLANAESSAEVLDARDMASAAYDMAKSAARLARAKQAHDEIIGTVYRAQADALAIEAAAKSRLADEYDAAQERGEVKSTPGPIASSAEVIRASDLGLSHKEIHEARQIRDAERDDPGIVRRTVDSLLDAGEEPTKAAVKRAINAQPAQPRVSDKSLWLWGRLRDLERENILNIPMANLLDGMTAEMIADLRRLAPLVREFLETLEVSLESA